MKKTFIFLLASFISLHSTFTYACSCAPLENYLSETFDTASAVFLGVPIKSEPLLGNEEHIFDGRQLTTFKIVASFKGETASELDVRSSTSSAACGLTPAVDSGLYLVFAYSNGQTLTMNLCSTMIVDPRHEMVTRILKALPDLKN